MKHINLVTTFGIALLFTPGMHAQTHSWKPDPAHSSVEFSILHLGISRVHGHFSLTNGEVQWDEKDITKSKVSMTIDLKSVDTQNLQRDSDLKSDKFFETAKFPTGTFTSISVAKRIGGGLIVSGELSLHGVTKPVVLQVEGPIGPVDGMDKKQHMGFSATTTIDRTAFDIGGGYPAAVVGNEAKLTIDLDLAKQ